MVGVIDQSRGADALALDTRTYPYLETVDDLRRLVEELARDGERPVLAYTGSSPSEMLLNELANTTEELAQTGEQSLCCFSAVATQRGSEAVEHPAGGHDRSPRCPRRPDVHAAAVQRDQPVRRPMERSLQLACVLQCAETCGVIDVVFAMTIEYLGDRYSFGRPLSSYQALKHRLADDKMVLEACHATAGAAARAVATSSDDAAELVSVAKSWIGPHATELIQDAIQLHGGIGVTWEHDLHLYLRRATVNRVLHGTPEWHADRIAGRLLQDAS